MTPELDRIYLGDNLTTLKTWPDKFVHTCVTSPPYFGLRDYGTASWEGGDVACDHAPRQRQGAEGMRADRTFTATTPFRDECGKCGAKRVDAQIGLEQTPEEFIARLVEVFREVRRVLRDDGTLWVNMGDSYAGSQGNGFKQTLAKENASNAGGDNESLRRRAGRTDTGCKPKDLIGVPWMLAFALRADGWYLRQDIIWHKPNPMPESVEDRCTKAHEYFFLLSKSPNYFYDHEAIKEKAVYSESGRASATKEDLDPSRKRNGEDGDNGSFRAITMNRNKRSVWTVTTKPFDEAHFATFPTDLIAPCVLAGTSERGVCSECGAPHVRDLERVAGESKECPKTQAAREARGGHGKPVGTVGKSGSGRVDGYTKTIGWSPSCSCTGGGMAKAVVLDPFMGAGTTALVATSYGRAFIGCELNPEYKAIADRRVANELAQGKLL